MSKKKKDKRIIQEKEDYKEKLAKLLEKLEGQVVPSNAMTEEERHRKMSDVNIKYAVCNNVIHDKQCPILKGVSSEFIRLSEKYNSKYVQCAECACRAYIRYGAEDIENYEKYMEFFDFCEMSPRNIRRFYFNLNCTTTLDGNVMTVKNRMDTWKIIPNGNKGMVRLLHNNYDINSDGTRKIINGYHIQKDNINMKTAIDILTGYNRSGNIEKHISDFSFEVERKSRKSYRHFNLIQKLRYKFRHWAINHYGLNSEIHLDGFKSVEENGYPQDRTLCTYIWESKSKERYWMIGVYSEGKKAFCATFLENRRTIRQSKVIAWEAMSDSDFLI